MEIFKVSGAGKVAGSKVTEGEINSTSDVRIIRDGAIIYTGKVSTIFREKERLKQEEMAKLAAESESENPDDWLVE